MSHWCAECPFPCSPLLQEPQSSSVINPSPAEHTSESIPGGCCQQSAVLACLPPQTTSSGTVLPAHLLIPSRSHNFGFMVQSVRIWEFLKWRKGSKNSAASLPSAAPKSSKQDALCLAQHQHSADTARPEMSPAVRAERHKLQGKPGFTRSVAYAKPTFFLHLLSYSLRLSRTEALKDMKATFPKRHHRGEVPNYLLKKE